MPNKVVTPAHIRAVEVASENIGVPPSVLLLNAGTALAEFTLELYSQKNFSRGVVILCGNGNNAGDGFICANVIAGANIPVTIVLLCGDAQSALSINAYESLSSSIKIIKFEQNENDIIFALSACDIVIDAIYGTGFRGELLLELAPILTYANTSSSLKIACDIPSGVNSLNGFACENTIKCDYTVTFGAIKIGMLFYPTNYLSGEVIVANIGIPEEAFDVITEPVTLLNLSIIEDSIPQRKSNSHKGNFGKLLNLSGSRRMPGAAALSTLAAVRCGVGLCTLASSKSVTDIVSTTLYSATYLPLEENDCGQITYLNYENIIENSKTATAMLIGCGLCKSEEITELVCKLIENVECPIILDADGINAIIGRIDILRKAKASIILTPHPAELARILDVTTQYVLDNRVELSCEVAKRYGVTVVAKSAGTIIASSDGLSFVSTTGNSGLSRGGSGDVLAGMISSFVAQGMSPVSASCVGVYLHGLAADRVAERLSMQGMLPSDVIDELPLLFKEINR